MAANKKKDAAALYELLDKSTLKVTRKAGAPLKIPSWWSGRNAATPAAPAPADASAAPTDPAAAKPNAPPPRTPGGASPFGIRNSARLEELFLRYRPLILVLAALVVMIMIALVVFRATGPKTHAGKVPPIMVPGVEQPRLVPDNNSSRRSRGNTPSQRGGGQAATPAAAAPTARVYPSSQVQRRSGYYYLVIVTTLPQYARSAAQFIAAHGVSVTIEQAQRPYDAVVSVLGFRHRASRAARAFQRRVVQIGDLMPGARRAHRSIFNTAFFAQVHRSN